MSMLPLAKSENILTQAVDNELLIYNLENHRAVCLNETSAVVWRECNGKQSAAEISNIIGKKLKTSIDEDFVRLALDELQKEKLLENNDELDDPLAGISRREMVKKVGLASMVALPLVSSIVAPNAAIAQSNLLPLFAACASSPQCMSGNCFPSVAFGQVCCSSTTTTLGLGTAQISGCLPDCNSYGLNTCCIGSAVVVPDAACPVGQVTCRCSP